MRLLLAGDMEMEQDTRRYYSPRGEAKKKRVQRAKAHKKKTEKWKEGNNKMIAVENGG